MRLFPTLFRDVSLQRLSVTVFALTLLGCSHAPPADFAPDPGLVAQIRDIRIVTSYARACPGSVIATSYEAVLASAERVPFARSYDKKHPPRLHVVFLDRESADAVSQEDGDWVTNGNALETVTTGFRLSPSLPQRGGRAPRSEGGCRACRRPGCGGSPGVRGDGPDEGSVWTAGAPGDRRPAGTAATATLSYDVIIVG